MLYNDPFGLKERKHWWQVWRKKNENVEDVEKTLPKTDHYINNVDVVASKKTKSTGKRSNIYAANYNFWNWNIGITLTMDGGNGHAPAGHSLGVSNISGLLEMIGLTQRYEPNGSFKKWSVDPPSTRDAEDKMIGEGANGLEAITPDSSIKDTKTGGDKTNSHGESKNKWISKYRVSIQKATQEGKIKAYRNIRDTIVRKSKNDIGAFEDSLMNAAHGDNSITFKIPRY